MVRLKFSIHLVYEIVGQPADFIFNIHAAHTACQTVRVESLQVSQPVATIFHSGPAPYNRLLRLRAEPGRLGLKYHAEVDIAHHIDLPEKIGEMPVAQLPPEVLPYLYPSRYCESDKLQFLANQQFGHLPHGYARVEAIRRWVHERTRFTPGSSNFNTSAVDTLHQQAGVCRDFAHLMIALCRALNIPARFSSGLDYGADPALGPTDFHAYVEVFLAGRWYLFDPSGTAMPMGFVRIGTGRDAADISFATIFGNIKSEVPVLSIEATDDPAHGLILPYHCEQALSTDEAIAPLFIASEPSPPPTPTTPPAPRVAG
ncbi:MAG: transglutaminase family protein [Zoogloea sp.]|nr:transglutaminase family protein [Zoogloea sp.]